MKWFGAAGLAAWLLWANAAAADTFLYMAEEPGCYWCKTWDAEVSTAYPKTAEGQTAPLQRYNLKDGTPEGVSFDRPVMYTPTFILVKDGVEQGRIEGYPGEDFFWGLLERMLEAAKIPLKQTG